MGNNLLGLVFLHIFVRRIIVVRLSDSSTYCIPVPLQPGHSFDVTIILGIVPPNVGSTSPHPLQIGHL